MEAKFYPVRPDKKMILVDTLSLYSQISPLEKIESKYTKVDPITSHKLTKDSSDTRQDQEEAEECLKDTVNKCLSVSSIDSEEQHLTDIT